MNTNLTERSVRIADWIAELLRRRGISQAQLAAYIDADPSTVSVWLKGEKIPNSASCAKLAAYAGVPYEEVLRIAGHLPPAEAERPAPPRSIHDDAMELVSLLPYEVPIYDEIPIHAGDGGVPIQYAYLPRMARRRGALVGLVVTGDCMEPTIEVADVVVLDREAKPEDGDVVAIQTEDGWALRRYHVEKGGYVLGCDNPKAKEREIVPVTDSPIYPVIEIRKQRPRLRQR